MSVNNVDISILDFDRSKFNDLNLDDLRRNTDDFSPVDQFGNFAVNKDLKDIYVKFKKDGKNATLAALSSITQDIGSVLYENILNYVDNVSNIDVCKIEALKSIAQSLGIQYNIFDAIKLFPKEVIQLIDLFSIDVKYLQEAGFLNTDVFKEAITAEMNGNTRTDLEKKYEYYSVYVGIWYSFYKLITNNINATYVDSSLVVNDQTFSILNKIMYNISADILGIEHVDMRKENMLSTKNYLNVPLNFDQEHIVDQIELGKDSYDNYTVNEQKVLKLEAENRANFVYNAESQTYFYQYPTGKYAYYKEQKVKEYINLVLNNHIKNGDADYKNGLQIYDVDPNYFVATADEKKVDELFDISYDSHGKVTLYFKDEYVQNTANVLLNICLQLAKIRNEIKNIPQKYYIRGTFLLLSYLINEYLKKECGIDDAKVNVVEYYDRTEYFNQKTSKSISAYNGSLVNTQYFKNLHASDLGDLEQFYFNKLNMSDITTYSEKSSLYDFLTTIYEAGASDSYVDKMTLQPVVHSQDYQDKEFNEYNKQIFLKYNGNAIGYAPWYNHKNSTHSSYQIHPCLYNFVEYSNVAEVIKHTFNSVLADEYQKKITNNVSNYIGIYGNIINAWSNGIDDFYCYNSRYEYSDNKNKNGVVNPLVDYDGLFYQDAIEDLLNDSSKFIEDLSSRSNADDSYYKKYYKHLNLSENEAHFYANLLSNNVSSTFYRSSAATTNSYVHYDRRTMYNGQYRDYRKDADQEASYASFSYVHNGVIFRNIYSYSLDIYKNCYGLYKDNCTNAARSTSDGGTVMTRHAMELPFGQIVVKPKDHPIGFPMFGANGLFQNEVADFTLPCRFEYDAGDGVVGEINLDTTDYLTAFQTIDSLNMYVGHNVYSKLNNSANQIMNTISAIEFNNDLNQIAIAWSAQSATKERMPQFVSFGRIQKVFDNNLTAKFYKMYLKDIVHFELPYKSNDIFFDGFFKYSNYIALLLHKNVPKTESTQTTQLSVVKYVPTAKATTILSTQVVTGKDIALSYVDNIINISWLSCAVYASDDTANTSNIQSHSIVNCFQNKSDTAKFPATNVFSKYNDGYTALRTAIYSPARTTKNGNTGVFIHTKEFKVNEQYIESLTTNKLYCQNDVTPGFITLTKGEAKSNNVTFDMNKTYFFQFIDGYPLSNDMPFPFGRQAVKNGSISAIQINLKTDNASSASDDIFRCTEEDYTKYYDQTYFKDHRYHDIVEHKIATTDANWTADSNYVYRVDGTVNDEYAYYIKIDKNTSDLYPNNLLFSWCYRTTNNGTTNTYYTNDIIIYVNMQFSIRGNKWYKDDSFFTNNKYLKLQTGAAGILDIVQYNTNNVISKYYIKNISDGFSPKVAVRRIQ